MVHVPTLGMGDQKFGNQLGPNLIVSHQLECLKFAHLPMQCPAFTDRIKKVNKVYHKFIQNFLVNVFINNDNTDTSHECLET